MDNYKNPKYNPGVKDGKGRIIMIIIVAALVYWIYTFANEMFFETFDNKELETLPEEAKIEEIDNTTTDNKDDEFDINTAIDLNTFEIKTVNSDITDEATKALLRENKKKIIDELREKGQSEHIDIVEDAFDEFDISQ